jgi:hypothetical protein
MLALALLVVPNATASATEFATASATATRGADLAAAVSNASGQLRQAWDTDPSSANLPFPNTDPSSANLPFPRVRLLPAGASVDGSCNSKAPARRPAPCRLVCPHG